MCYPNLRGTNSKIGCSTTRLAALMIRAGVPKTWTVGDKTGRCANGATNDVAIIRPSGRAPILVAVYSIGSTSSADDRAAIVAEAARVIIEFLPK